MKLVDRSKVMQAAAVLTGALFLSVIPGMQSAAVAQDYSQPPSFSPRQLDSLVSRVALYPDPLLAQVFAAASFPDQIPDAARWANQYQNLHGNELADAIYQANLQFDPAVQALIPFPAVLDTMARDMNWTSELGEAVLVDRRDVMDAVQRMRRSADEYGYLQSNQQMRVVNSGYGIEIEPADPSLIYVPVYDPYVVYAPPRPGFFLGGAIRTGSCYPIGAFSGWGWGGGFNWNSHSVFVNRAVWGRNWDNRAAYVHNYGNWDRGEWRNNYNNRNVTIYNNRSVYQNENVNRYSNTYSNSGRDYRGLQQGQPVQQSPVVQNRTYDRNTVDRNTYRTDNRNNNGQFSNGYPNQQSNGYRAGQPAPAAPVVNAHQPNSNRDLYRNTSSNPGMYRGAQSAPVAPAAPVVNTYQPNANRDSYRNSNPGMYRGAQSAPVAPAAPVSQNRTFERNTYSNPTVNSAPAVVMQGRSFGCTRNCPGANGT